MSLVSGGADKSARLFDVTTGRATQIAQHDAPVKEVRWVDGASPIVATGSWDKTIKVKVGRTNMKKQWVNPCLSKRTQDPALIVAYIGPYVHNRSTGIFARKHP